MAEETQCVWKRCRSVADTEQRKLPIADTICGHLLLLTSLLNAHVHHAVWQCTVHRMQLIVSSNVCSVQCVVWSVVCNMQCAKLTIFEKGIVCEGKWRVTGEHLPNDAARTTESPFLPNLHPKIPNSLPNFQILAHFCSVLTNY